MGVPKNRQTTSRVVCLRTPACGNESPEGQRECAKTPAAPYSHKTMRARVCGPDRTRHVSTTAPSKRLKHITGHSHGNIPEENSYTGQLRFAWHSWKRGQHDTPRHGDPRTEFSSIRPICTRERKGGQSRMCCAVGTSSGSTRRSTTATGSTTGSVSITPTGKWTIWCPLASIWRRTACPPESKPDLGGFPASTALMPPRLALPPLKHRPHPATLHKS